MQKMIQLEKEELDDSGYTYTVDMVDLISKKEKTARLCIID